MFWGSFLTGSINRLNCLFSNSLSEELTSSATIAQQEHLWSRLLSAINCKGLQKMGVVFPLSCQLVAANETVKKVQLSNAIYIIYSCIAVV